MANVKTVFARVNAPAITAEISALDVRPESKTAIAPAAITAAFVLPAIAPITIHELATVITSTPPTSR